MKKKLLIYSREQYGYLTDYLKYCDYLKNTYDISYLCWDLEQPKYETKDIKVIYLNKKGNVVFRFFKILCYLMVNISQFDCSIISYFPSCFLLLLKNSSKTILLDIRTASVDKKLIIRKLKNIVLKFDLLFYKHISILSENIAKKIGLKKYYFLPLGADIISDTNKSFDNINLIYIGTLYNRKIDDTILGFSLFQKKNNNKIAIHYDIIGGSIDKNDGIRIKNLIIESHLTDFITYHGSKKHCELKQYLDNANIGISYIPITDYYDHQPATKTFEYLLSGMPVIATNTSANKSIINNLNGTLINDTPDSFCNGICEIIKNKNIYNSIQIREEQKLNTWENIISNHLTKILNNISL